VPVVFITSLGLKVIVNLGFLYLVVVKPRGGPLSRVWT
jgi:hypothetical protein